MPMSGWREALHACSNVFGDGERLNAGIAARDNEIPRSPPADHPVMTAAR
jgi:hypothetical protein